MTKEINFDIILNELVYNGTSATGDNSDEIKQKYSGTILDNEVI